MVLPMATANPFLVRAEARTGELAIRFAPGARRRRLTGSVLLESLPLGLAGASSCGA